VTGPWYDYFPPTGVHAAISALGYANGRMYFGDYVLGTVSIWQLQQPQPQQLEWRWARALGCSSIRACSASPLAPCLHARIHPTTRPIPTAQIKSVNMTGGDPWTHVSGGFPVYISNLPGVGLVYLDVAFGYLASVPAGTPDATTSGAGGAHTSGALAAGVASAAGALLGAASLAALAAAW
jgi:hypothetical protein